MTKISRQCHSVIQWRE